MDHTVVKKIKGSDGHAADRPGSSHGSIIIADGCVAIVGSRESKISSAKHAALSHEPVEAVA